MGENTKISWAHHTCNFWIGCTKVSPGCANCYAETQQDHLYHRVKWGKGNDRSPTKNYIDCHKWNRKCIDAGIRERVFTNSLADVFDEEVPDAWRDHAFNEIRKCESLDWLILTKRLQKAKSYLANLPGWPFPNVWLGASVENQETADSRIPILLEIPAAIHFLSMEPLLASINLFGPINRGQKGIDLDWVIVGGESGENFRPMNPNWALTVFAQCKTMHISFFCKQGSGLLSGCQYNLPNGIFDVKEFPR